MEDVASKTANESLVTFSEKEVTATVLKNVRLDLLRKVVINQRDKGHLTEERTNFQHL